MIKYNIIKMLRYIMNIKDYKIITATVLMGVIFSVAGLYANPSREDNYNLENLNKVTEINEENMEASRVYPYFEGGTAAAFGGIFLLGLALNLTPCVYPMLTITVSIFGAGGKYEKFKTFLRSGVYVLGIATMYSVLGVIAAFTGGLFGGLLQSETVIFSIAMVFFILSLSMFGVYEFKVPAAISGRLTTGKNTGLTGLYLSGLFVGIFAAPCVGPPVIGLLTLVGQQGNPFFGFAVFFVLSLGLGLPYLILGTFSGLLNKLPGSGEWMVWVRKLLGIALVGVGVFYLSLVFSPRLIFIFIPVVLVVGSVFLGFIEKSGSSGPVFPWIKRVTGLILLTIAVIIFRAGREPSVEWDDYSRDRISSAAEKNKPVLLYFSADWCIPCMELDRRTFTDIGVMERLADFELLKVDLTDYDSPSSRVIREKFDVAGVPTVVFLDETGRELMNKRIVGFVTPSGFKDTLKKVEKMVTLNRTKQAGGEKEAEENLSRIKLISDKQWIKPGEPFYLGVLFDMKKGWHVYWINPGDSGMKPRLEWDIPDKFSAGELRWPGPEKFREGPFFTYGHGDSLLLSRKVIPPEDIEPGTTVHFKIDGNWLVCKDICVTQKGNYRLTVPVREAEPVKEKEWEQVFKETKKMLPKDHNWQFNPVVTGSKLVLEVLLSEEIPEQIFRGSEFFSLKSGFIQPGEYSWEKTEGGYQMEIPLKQQAEKVEILEGVLVLPGKIEEVPRVLVVDSEIIYR